MGLLQPTFCFAKLRSLPMANVRYFLPVCLDETEGLWYNDIPAT
jgi:hypothetical protein